MFSGIDDERYSRLSKQELRSFDNIKKAFFHSDEALRSGHPEDGCLAELFKAVDTAESLRRSLRGEDTSHADNRKRFIEFLGLDIPACRPGDAEFELRDRKTGQLRKYTLGDIIYHVRCMMVHENENLNVAEDVDYHVLLDWSHPNPRFPVTIQDGALIWNGYFIWNRLREVMSKFITVIDCYVARANGATSFSVTSNPELGSIAPERRQKQA